MVNYKEKFAEAKTIAVNEGFESTRAEWLFLDVFGWSKTDYLIHKDEQMSLTSINKWIKRWIEWSQENLFNTLLDFSLLWLSI